MNTRSAFVPVLATLALLAPVACDDAAPVVDEELLLVDDPEAVDAALAALAEEDAEQLEESLPIAEDPLTSDPQAQGEHPDALSAGEAAPQTAIPGYQCVTKTQTYTVTNTTNHWGHFPVGSMTPPPGYDGVPNVIVDIIDGDYLSASYPWNLVAPWQCDMYISCADYLTMTETDTPNNFVQHKFTSDEADQGDICPGTYMTQANSSAVDFKFTDGCIYSPQTMTGQLRLTVEWCAPNAQSWIYAIESDGGATKLSKVLPDGTSFTAISNVTYGGANVGVMDGLAMTDDGVLWGFIKEGSNMRLVTINKSTGVATNKALFTNRYIRGAYGGNANLRVVDSTTDSTYLINTTTFAISGEKPLLNPDGTPHTLGGYSDIAVDSTTGVVLFSGPNKYTVNTSTGQLTLRSTLPHAYGGAAGAYPGSPGNILLLRTITSPDALGTMHEYSGNTFNVLISNYHSGIEATSSDLAARE